ncbi:MAG: UPF0280 family protein [Candidatus Saganbacteria bacterium]|nr:UPF0280 family protein [Candidatus Saganbacteria bacterium]
MYEERTYRGLVKSKDLVLFEVVQEETDLLISAEKDIRFRAEDIVKKIRIELTKYIIKNPAFETSFVPVKASLNAPQLVRSMIDASKRFNVGPMASVAGAVAEAAGKKLLRYSKQVIVENGGDIFIKSSEPRTMLIYAGKSKFSNKIALEIDPKDTPLGVCTSSGTVGHSFSFGSADAVVVIARSAATADAAATAIGNLVKKQDDIEEALKFAKKFGKLKGVLIIKDDRMGMWGKIKIRRV